MNKDEMIKDMAKAIRKAMVEYVGEKYYELCVAGFSADIISKALYNANYRKVADDEIVLKKDEYEKLKKYRTDWLNSEKMHLQAELEDTEFELGCSNRLFQKVCEEKKELEKQLEQAKLELEVRENEIVLKKEDYEKLCHLAYFGYEDVRQETARMIFQKMKDGIENSAFGYLVINRNNIIELAKNLGIELEE